LISIYGLIAKSVKDVLSSIVVISVNKQKRNKMKTKHKDECNCLFCIKTKKNKDKDAEFVRNTCKTPYPYLRKFFPLLSKTNIDEIPPED